MKVTHLKLVALLLSGTLASAALATELTVSAAASLTNALQDIAPLFQAAHPGTQVQLNFAASGDLLQQIAKGAPVDVFITADPDTMNRAEAKALMLSAQRRNIAVNTLVVIVPTAPTRVPLPHALADLAQPAYARIAIGLPASVPVGQYAKAALEAAGLWPAIEPKMIGVQNVRQALDYVARGEVDAGFVYATDAALLPAKVKVALVVDTAAPIVYPAAAVAASPQPALAQRFIDFLLSAPAQAVLARYGFRRP